MPEKIRFVCNVYLSCQSQYTIRNLWQTQDEQRRRMAWHYHVVHQFLAGVFAFRFDSKLPFRICVLFGCRIRQLNKFPKKFAIQNIKWNRVLSCCFIPKNFCRVNAIVAPLRFQSSLIEFNCLFFFSLSSAFISI